MCLHYLVKRIARVLLPYITYLSIGLQVVDFWHQIFTNCWNNSFQQSTTVSVVFTDIQYILFASDADNNWQLYTAPSHPSSVPRCCITNDFSSVRPLSDVSDADATNCQAEPAQLISRSALSRYLGQTLLSGQIDKHTHWSGALPGRLLKWPVNLLYYIAHRKAL